MRIQGWFPVRLTDLLSLLSKGLESSPAPQFENINSLTLCLFIIQLSQPYATIGKTIAWTLWTFVSKVISLLFNTLSRFVIAFLPRSNRLLISSLQSPSAGFPCGSAGKESACNVGDLGLIPGLGRSPEEGEGYPFQYSGVENTMDWMVHGVEKSQTWLNDFHHTLTTCSDFKSPRKGNLLLLPPFPLLLTRKWWGQMPWS